MRVKQKGSNLPVKLKSVKDNDKTLWCLCSTFDSYRFASPPPPPPPFHNNRGKKIKHVREIEWLKVNFFPIDVCVSCQLAVSYSQHPLHIQDEAEGIRGWLCQVVFIFNTTCSPGSVRLGTSVYIRHASTQVANCSWFSNDLISQLYWNQSSNICFFASPEMSSHDISTVSVLFIQSCIDRGW